MGHALRERRKCGKQRFLGSPQATVSDDFITTKVESIDPQRAKLQQRVYSSQGDEFQNQMSMFDLFASEYTKGHADSGHTRVSHDHHMSTAASVAHVLGMTSEDELDETDLPDNFDIDSIF